jgi:hypothetical protein
VSAGSPTSSPTTSPSESEGERDFDLFRLRLGHVIALLAALALLFIMAGDWYSTATGVEAREIVERGGGEGLGTGVFDEGAVEDARIQAERAERNAWQVGSVLDLLVLLALLATIALVLAAVAFRAAGREVPAGRRSPTALAAFAALLSLLLLVAQAASRLDPDSEATIRIGLPLGVAALGMIACGAGLALREEVRGGGDETAGEPSARAGTPRAAGEGPPPADAPERRRA